MTTDLIYAAVIALIGFRLYRRSKSLLGEQPFVRKRMVRRLWVLAAVLALILLNDTQQVQLGLAHPAHALLLALVASLAGIVGGVALGVWSVRLAELRWDAGVLKLRAHVFIGPAILLLYVLRVIYKFWLMQHLGVLSDLASAAPAVQHALAQYDIDPLGAFLRMLVFAYYFSYYPLLLRRARAMQSAAPLALADQP
jgi:hypothetical protein